MHNWHDQFVKEVFHEALDPLGTARQEVEISADAQRIDFFFVPNPALVSGPPPQDSPLAGASDLAPEVPVAARATPAILAKMARTACLLEHYLRPPDLRAVRGCLRKQLTRFHLDGLAAAKVTDAETAVVSLPGGAPTNAPLGPVLWVLSSGRPADVVAGFALRRLRGWPRGTYEGPLPALPYRLIVLSELPEIRYTLPLRLLGRGATFRRALAELKKLPGEAWERQHIARLLIRWRSEMPEAVASSDAQTEEEKEILMTFDDYLHGFEEKGRQQGLQQGVQQGLQQGVQQGLHQHMVKLYARKLGRPLSEDERTRLLTRLDTLGPDRLDDVVLQLSPTALAAWLADPDAK